MSDKEKIGAIGVDLGTFTSNFSIVQPGSSKLFHFTKFPALPEQGPNEYVDRLVKAVNGVKKKYDGDIIGLGMGIPSWNGAEEMIHNSPNMPLFNDFKLLEALKAGLPWLKVIKGDNDANVAGWGELRYGKWPGAEKGICGSTLGGGHGFFAFLYNPNNGELILVTGRNKRGGEGGHVTIPRPPGAPVRKCGCGSQFCAEAYISATAAISFARFEMASNRNTLIVDKVKADLALDHNYSIMELVNPIHIEQAAKEGDKAALDIQYYLSFALAYMIRNAIEMFDPAVYVVCGGMSHWKGLITQTKKILRELNDGVVPYNETMVVASRLKNSGILGPAAMVLDKCF